MTFSDDELEVDVVELAHQRGDAGPGAAGAAHVDRQAQRVPAVHPGAPDEPLVENVEARDLADRGSRRVPRPAIVSASSSRPATAACRRAASSEAVSRALGLVDSVRVTQRSTTSSSISSPWPRWRIADWVRLPTSLWTEERTRSAPHSEGALGQQRREAQMGAPGLVDDQRHAALVGDLGEARDVGDGAEVGRRDTVSAATASGVAVERLGERLRSQAVGDAELAGRAPERRTPARARRG